MNVMSELPPEDDWEDEEEYLFPTSYAQQRLWVLDQLFEKSAAYNIASAIEIQGPLDVQALEASINHIVERHETLRSTFCLEQEEACQLVKPFAPLTLDCVEILATSFADEKDHEQAYSAHLQTFSETIFDLQTGPLFLVKLLKIENNRHILAICQHHIICDAWSIGLFVKELSHNYLALVNGETPSMPELEIQYVDFSIWQRESLGESGLAQQQAYWSEQLAGIPDCIDLPLDNPRPKRQTLRGDNIGFSIEGDSFERLKNCCQNAGATLTMGLMALYGVLLSRYANQQDVVIGTAIANRNRHEIEPLIGLFANTLAIRIKFEDNPSFTQLLSHVRETLLGAYANQDLPFERLVNALKPKRNTAYSPLFQVMFLLQNAPVDELKLGDLKLDVVDMENHTAKYDLTMNLTQAGDVLYGNLEYNCDLFEKQTITQLVADFKSLVDLLTQTPELPVGQLSLVDNDPIAQLQGLPQSLPHQPLSVAKWFEQQAAKTPDAIALDDGNEQLSYRALDEASNRLAHYLQSRGAEPEKIIAVALMPSNDLIITLLAVVKSGAAYLPLDPQFPAERIEYMLQDAEPMLLITSNELETQQDTIAQQPTTPISVETSPGNLAYVIYTSGSTGKPKGVQIEHSALSHFLQAMQQHLQVCEQDKWLMQTTVSFDIAALELFLPILTGAKLIVASREQRVDGDLLAALITQQDITIMQATPSSWRMLLSADWQGKQDLTMLCGGEALSCDVAKQLLNRGKALFNLYGPTETTIWSSIAKLDESLLQGQLNAPLGKALASEQLYILDKQLQRVPVGVTGQLYIGGAGLSRGYLNHQSLTEERFIDNPYGKGRLYATGDLVKLSRDGQIHYLGRNDFQVKVRGFRIETGEIESKLRQHDEIDNCVVVVTNDRLTAYIVIHHSDNQSKVIDSVKTHLHRCLPEYMQPNVYIVLPQLPQTLNGKVDRNALPALDEGDSTQAVELPRNDLEAQLLSIWQEVLERQNIGIFDDFFDLGGHSFLLFALKKAIGKTFGSTLPLVTLIENTTIAKLAELLTRADKVSEYGFVVQLNKLESADKAPLFVLPGAGGQPLYLTALAQAIGTNRAVYGFQSQGIDDGLAPFTSVQDIARRYITGMKHHQAEGPYLLCGHSFGCHIGYEMVRQLQAAGDEVAQFIVLDSFAPVIDIKPFKPNRSFASWLMELIYVLETLAGQKSPITESTLNGLEKSQQLQMVHNWAKQVPALLTSSEPQYLSDIIEVYKTNLSIHYRPQGSIKVPQTLLKSQQSVELGEQLSDAFKAELARLERHPSWGWDEINQGTIDSYSVKGDHNTMLTAGFVEHLARQINQILDKAIADSGENHADI